MLRGAALIDLVRLYDLPIAMAMRRCRFSGMDQWDIWLVTRALIRYAGNFLD